MILKKIIVENLRLMPGVFLMRGDAHGVLGRLLSMGKCLFYVKSGGMSSFFCNFATYYATIFLNIDCVVVSCPHAGAAGSENSSEK